MITAVDTNVLLDVFRNDPVHCHASSEALRKCMKEGALVVCEIVWAELAAVFNNSEGFSQAMTSLGIRFSSVEPDAAETAGILWSHYRMSAGKRSRVIADFIIAAHAMEQCDRLLSRDRGFYRHYFKQLELLEP